MTDVRESLYRRKRWVASAALLFGALYFLAVSYVFGVAVCLTVLVFCWSALPHAERHGRGPIYERHGVLVTTAILSAIGSAVETWLVFNPD